MAKTSAGSVGAALTPMIEKKVTMPLTPQDAQELGMQPPQPGQPPIMVTKTMKADLGSAVPTQKNPTGMPQGAAPPGGGGGPPPPAAPPMMAQNPQSGVTPEDQALMAMLTGGIGGGPNGGVA